MFLANCPTCGLRELRGARSIQLLVNSDLGPELVYACNSCGATNVVDGSRRRQVTAKPATAPAAA